VGWLVGGGLGRRGLGERERERERERVVQCLVLALGSLGLLGWAALGCLRYPQCANSRGVRRVDSRVRPVIVIRGPAAGREPR
jgi:hypothetical protein